MRKAVFLDRDGTLIIDKVYLNNPKQIEWLPGALEGLQRLHEAGYTLIVVTNQSGVARGIVSLENLAEIHRRIAATCERNGAVIAGFYFAPGPADQPHPLRKPNPGMLLTGAEEHGIDLKQSWMVGDRYTDVQAGQKAGCRCIFLPGVEQPPSRDEAFTATSFTEVVQIILSSKTC